MTDRPERAAGTPVLVAARYEEAARERLCQLFAPSPVTFVRHADSAEARAVLPRAQVVITADHPTRGVIEAPALRWLHVNHAGLETVALPELLERGITVTSAAGRSAPALAEHALFFMLALVNDAPAVLRAQRRRVWGLAGCDGQRCLNGRRVLIVGHGTIAQALIPTCRALGMKVSILRRSAAEDGPEDVTVYSAARGDRLADIVAAADIIVLAAALNDTTHEMVHAEVFARMRPGTLMVNMARAGLVARQDMLAALRSGRLGGLGIDVAHQEPLPPWDALWWQRNVIITPHHTPRMPDRPMREVDIIEDTLARLDAGERPPNAMTEADVYTKGPPPPSLALRAVCRAWRLVFRTRVRVR